MTFGSTTELREQNRCADIVVMIHIQRVSSVGFEPTKHYALHIKCNPFDHSGKMTVV